MFSLNAYTITVNKTGSREIELLDSFDGVADLSKVFHEFVSHGLSNDFIDAAKKRIVRFNFADPHSHAGYSFKVLTGEYGFTSDLYDTGTKRNAHKRTKKQAEMLPFHVYVYIPRRCRRGVIIFQRFKQFGVRGYIADQFLPYFNTRFPNYSVKISKAVPAVVLEQLLAKAHVKAFRFVKHQASTDICDALHALDQDGATSEIEYVVKAKRRGFFGTLDPLKKEFKKPVPNFKSIVEIPNFDYDTIKVDIDMAGKRRSIDLGNIMRISGTIDITDEVETDDSGHPTKDSFVKVAKQLARTLMGS